MRMLDGVLNLEKRTVVKRRRQWIPFYAKSVEPNCHVPLRLTKGYHQQLIAWDDTLHWILEWLGVTGTRSRLVKLTNRHTSDWQNIPRERLASSHCCPVFPPLTTDNYCSLSRLDCGASRPWGPHHQMVENYYYLVTLHTISHTQPNFLDSNSSTGGSF